MKPSRVIILVLLAGVVFTFHDGNIAHCAALVVLLLVAIATAVLRSFFR